MKKLNYLIIPLTFSLFLGAQEIVDETLNSQVDANIPGVVAQKEIDNLDEQAKNFITNLKIL